MSLSAAGSCSSPSLLSLPWIPATNCRSKWWLSQTCGTLLLLRLPFLTTSLLFPDLASFPNGVLFFHLSPYHAPTRAVWNIPFPLNLPFDQIIAVTVVSVRGDTKKAATSAFFRIILDPVAPILCVLQLNMYLRNALGFERISIIFC